jgi:hypothetical protein
MTFLPIVDRELRLAARKRSTFWLRIVAALVAMVVGTALMILSLFGAFNTATLGRALFGTLTWLAFGAALSAGLFFTSDCLSEEKREGTLGFLFLTDLRGYDVAGGKLLATSLRGCFALLAIFPILAITLLMGGVTGVEFWERTLALVNALICSLAAGLFVSAISRDPQKAMAGTLFLLLLWLAGGLLADGILSLTHWGTTVVLFSLSSPLWLFSKVGAWGRNPFWSGLLLNQLIAWLLFGLASVLVPRTWQERPAAKSSFSTASWSYLWRYGGARRRAALRRQLIGRNAVLWLACRERWQSVGVWLIALLVVIAFVTLLVTDLPAQVWIVWNSLCWIFLWLLYLWAASQASRFFIEARRSGLIELLMAAPVSVRDIVEGQWRALLRLFAPAVVLVLAVQLAGSYLAGTRAVGLVPASARNMMPTLVVTVAGSSAGVIAVAANLVAICWFGMWMGMTSKTNNLATLKTLLFVQVIPGMAISFASALAVPLVVMPMILKGGLTSNTGSSWVASTFAQWVPLITIGVGTTLALGKDVGFVVWARRMLLETFREQATRSEGAFRYSVPPLVAPPIAAPPVIPLPQ